ncbi:MAG: 16S rRNA (guanine(527)-N(7))-methyltransferase RsmG, partial [Eudoraea sp.]
VQVFEMSEFFEEDFFKTKKVVYLPMKYKGNS